MGRGKVFMFSSTPAVQLITLRSTFPLLAGQFRLNYTAYGSTQMTARLGFNTSAVQMKHQLEALSNVDLVTVVFLQVYISMCINIYT
jgi:hypothetical protein